MKTFNEYSTPELVAYINKSHWEDKKSLRAIAKELGTYSTRIWRFCSKHNIPLMSSGEAIKAYYSENDHPNKNKPLSEKQKEQIGKSQLERWKNVDSMERARIKDMQKKIFENRQDKDEFHKKGARAIRKAVDEGSKVEKFIAEFFTKNQIEFIHHYRGIFGNTNLEADFFLPEHSIVIEVDGVSHFRNNFSEDTYTAQMEADERKNGIILSYGGSVIRVQHQKNLSQTVCRKICAFLLDLINNVDNELVIINGDEYE
jgi:very-short-patch-repair endonuclease